MSEEVKPSCHRCGQPFTDDCPPEQMYGSPYHTAGDCITALRAALDQERATTLDLAMLVRRMELELRLIPQPRTERLRAKALDYLKRKGLSGSVLRSVADPALLSGRGEVSDG